MKLLRNKSTKEGREFWAWLEKNARKGYAQDDLFGDEEFTISPS